MSSHLTVRMAWHDNNWDGHVCKNPEQNSYCIGSHSLLSGRIARKRKLDVEQGNCCKKADCLGDYVPPCYWSINAFGKNPLEVKHEHAFDHVKVDKIPETLSAHSVFSWPFKLSFVHNDENKKLEGNYWHDLKQRIVNFTNKFKEQESVVFFYSNYDNPVSADDMKYLLLGCALLSNKGQPTYFKDTTGDLTKIRKTNHAMKNFPDMNWALQFSYDFKNNGILLPYKEYLEYIEENPAYEEKLAEMRVLIEEESLVSGFKYVAMDIDDDKCIYLLYKLKKAIQIIKQHAIVDKDYARDEAVIERLLEMCWKKRGLYPSLSRILSVLSENDALSEGLVSAIRQIVEERKVVDYLFDILSGQVEIPSALERFGGFADDLTNLLKNKKDLIAISKKLSLFNLTKRQIHRILNSAKEKPFGKKSVNTSDIISNPYILCESYKTLEPNNDIPDVEDETIDLFKIDIGMFPDSQYLRRNPDLQNLPPDSPQRLRSVIIEYLRTIGQQGDCYEESKEIIKHIGDNPLFYKKDIHLDEAAIRSLVGEYYEHFKEKLTLISNEGGVFFYLNEVRFAEALIREVVGKLTKNRADYGVEKDYFDSYIENSAVELSGRPGFDKTSFIAERKQLFEGVLKKSFFVITGKPGSGKTHELGKFIKYFKDKNETCLLLAPTGKATLRLADKTQASSETIDRFLTRSGFYSYLNDYELLPEIASVEKIAFQNVIIDECSMVDLFKLAILFSVLRLDDEYPKRIILVGDENQLPPIGFGKPFFDIIKQLNPNQEFHSDSFIKLMCECRQENDPVILELAEVFADKKRYYEPLIDKLKTEGKISDGFFVDKWRNMDDLVAKIERRMTELFEHEFGRENALKLKDNRIALLNKVFGLYDNGFVNCQGNNFCDTLQLDNFQILTPYRAGYFGTTGLNQHIQSNYRATDYFLWNTPFLHADKIIRVNNWYYWNRDTRRKELRLSNGSIGVINVKNRFRKDYRYFFNEIGWPLSYLDDEENFELAYAITIHKSQGSDFKNVFLVVPKKQGLLSKELLYTALTRSKFRLFLFVQDSETSPLEVARGISFVNTRNTSIFESPLESKGIFQPKKGVFVRSKVEYVIFKALQARGIEPNYETPLELPNKKYIIHPDFTIRLPSGNVVYWEHLGMLDIRRYTKDWETRKEDYTSNKLFDNIITTDDLEGIHSDKVEKIIDDILTNNLKDTKGSKFSNHHYTLY